MSTEELFYDIPQTWQLSRLGELIKLSKKGLRTNSDEVAFVPMDLIPSDGRKYVEYKILNRDDIRSGISCDPGDLLLSKITPCFENYKQGIVPDIPNRDWFATTEVFPIKTYNEKLERDFLFWLLLHPKYRSTIANKMQGATGRQRVPREVLENLVIPLPLLAEQRAIARVLTTVRQAIEATERVIEATRQLKKAMMKHLFTYGPVPVHAVDGVQLKETEIGWVPAGWEIGALADFVCQEKNDGLGQVKSKENIPFIPMSLIPEDGMYLNNWEMRQRSEIRSGIPVSNGQLLIAKITPCFENGKQVIVSGLPNSTGFASTEVIPIRTSDRLSIEYLAYYLQRNEIRKLLTAKMEGTTGRRRLPKYVLLNLKLPIPPTSEQIEITSSIKYCDEKLRHEISCKEALGNIFQSLLFQLMTGNIRVNDLQL